MNRTNQLLTMRVVSGQLWSIEFPASPAALLHPQKASTFKKVHPHPPSKRCTRTHESTLMHIGTLVGAASKRSDASSKCADASSKCADDGLLCFVDKLACGKQSELSARSGSASPLSHRPLSGAEVRPLELLFGAERTNSSACAQSLCRHN